MLERSSAEEASERSMVESMAGQLRGDAGGEGEVERRFRGIARRGGFTRVDMEVGHYFRATECSQSARTVNI